MKRKNADIVEKVDVAEVITRREYQKSNYLISAKYKSNIMENKLLALSMSRAKHFEDDGKGHLVDRISAKDIRTALKINSTSLYYELKRIAKGMAQGRSIGYEDPITHSFEYHVLVTDIYYDNATLTVNYNANMKDLLQKFDKDHSYTKLNLNVMMSWTSPYTFRLYEIIKSKCFPTSKYRSDKGDNTYTFSYNLSELMFELGLLDGNASESVRNILNKSSNPDYDKARELALKYTAKPLTAARKYSEFKRTILDRAVNEIHDNAGINMHIEYVPIKKGKGGKVADIVFSVTIGNPKIIAADIITNVELTQEQKEDFLDDLEELFDAKVKTRDRRSIAEAANYDMALIEEKYELSKGQQIENFVGWMVSAIKNDYSAPVASGKRKGTAFSNFEENSYNFDELEAALLDN